MFPGQLGWYGGAPGFLPSGLPGLLPGAYAPGGGSQPRLEASGEQPETRAALIVHFDGGASTLGVRAQLMAALDRCLGKSAGLVEVAEVHPAGAVLMAPAGPLLKLLRPAALGTGVHVAPLPELGEAPARIPAARATAPGAAGGELRRPQLRTAAPPAQPTAQQGHQQQRQGKRAPGPTPRTAQTQERAPVAPTRQPRAGAGGPLCSRFFCRCTALGLEAARLLLSLYRQMVDSTLSYGAAVWSPGLALAAVRRLGTQAGAAGGGSGLSAAEQQHFRTLRRLLGLPQRVPRATVLAETGEPPLHAHWLARTARFWNSLVEAPEGSLMRQVLDASLQLAADHTPSRHRGPHGIAQMPWAAQLQSALAEAGIAADLQQRQPLQPEAVQEAALQHYLQHLQTAVQRRGASRLQHYFDCVRPECLEVAGYGMAPYLVEVRERHRRLGLAELRSGVHWGAEERERLLGPARRPRDQRYCMHCAAAGLGGRAEDADHIVFECALYAHLRPIWFPDIFPAGQPPLPPETGSHVAQPNRLATLLGCEFPREEDSAMAGEAGLPPYPL